MQYVLITVTEKNIYRPTDSLEINGNRVNNTIFHVGCRGPFKHQTTHEHAIFLERMILTDTKKHEDLTAQIIGDFGIWQMRISLLMAVLKLPIAWYQLNIIFMAPQQEFWCAKPAIFYRYADEEWRRICAPRVEEHPCLIFDPYLLIDGRLDRTLIPLVPCEYFVYNDTMFKRTIISDWDLVCSNHWLVHICQCVMMCGILVGSLIFGSVADKYGRKKPLITAIVIQAVASLLASIIPWFWVFLLDWLMLALANGGLGVISFVLCMEVVSGKWRTVIPVIYQLPFGIGNAVMAGLAYWLRDWRKLELALASFSSLYALYWFWIPESPRWLIATGQTEKAAEVLAKAAKLNGRRIHRKQLKRLLEAAESKTAATRGEIREPGFIAFFKSKNMRKKTVLLSMNWFCTGLSFYTFAQYLGTIGGNIFVAVAVTGVISAIGGSTCIYVITRYGRKKTVAIYQAVTSLCFILILLMRKGERDWLRLLFAGIGFGGMAGTIPALYLFSGELYPTLGRNKGLSGVSLFARIASMIAPAVVTLQNIIEDLPLIILAIISLSQILMIMPLPETKGLPLPDTLEDAERI